MKRKEFACVCCLLQRIFPADLPQSYSQCTFSLTHSLTHSPPPRCWQYVPCQFVRILLVYFARLTRFEDCLLLVWGVSKSNSKSIEILFFFLCISTFFLWGFSAFMEILKITFAGGFKSYVIHVVSLQEFCGCESMSVWENCGNQAEEVDNINYIWQISRLGFVKEPLIFANK